jgi:fimbrial chaperone protein
VIRAIAASLLGVVAAAGSAAASTLSVAPIRVELSSVTSTAVLTLRNAEDSPVVVQVQPVLWSQREGQEQLEDTHDLLVTPPLFTVPPKGSQIIRIFLRRPPEAARELDYRIVLSEVPPVAAADNTGLRMALRITLPVFVAPRAHAAPELIWHHTWAPDGTLRIEAHNRGTAHIQILDFDAQNADHDHTEQRVHADSARYLLPGTVARWQLQPETGMAGAARILVHGHSDAGDFTVTSDPSAE